MKTNKLVLLVGTIFFLSCSQSLHWKLKVEMPGESQIDLEKFERIVITDFLVKKETKDIDLNHEIRDYLNFELGQKLKGKVKLKSLPIENDKVFENQDFWKGLHTDAESTLIFTGTADYTEEVRKAILETKKDRFEDPFPRSKKLAERRFYTLKLDLYLIDSQSGEILYRRNFKETKGYRNPNQTAYFAFFDLIQRVKVKLLRNILGDTKIEERYLISK